MTTVTKVESVEHDVSEMLKAGRSFMEIEQFIDTAPVDKEHRDVLWLLAWAEQPRMMRRLILHTTLALVPGD